MNRTATFEVVDRSHSPDYLVIRDVGFHDRQLSVTNDIEGVVERLAAAGKIGLETRLFAYDSLGDLDEILLTTETRGRYSVPVFAGFRRCRSRDHHELARALRPEIV